MASIRTSDFETLLQLLHDEQSALQALQATLFQEQEALASNDIDALNQVTETKAQQVEALNGLVVTRGEHLSTLGLGNDLNGIESALRQAPSSKMGQEARGLWQENVALLEACHQQNQVNGIIIEAGTRSTRLVLDLLQQPPNPPTTTYDKKGRKSQSNGKPPLAKA